MPKPTTRPTTSAALTYALRQLVWGIESEVAVISSLSRRIDERVERVNALRAEAADRLLRLDVLVQAADDPQLEAFLRAAVEAPMPSVPEDFPDRLYRS